MKKTILITGSTDGIGLDTAKRLAGVGHRVLIHGRSSEKLSTVKASLAQHGEVESYEADLSDLRAVVALAKAIHANEKHLDVLINNAGVYNAAKPVTGDGLDVRFVVNTIAPYLLTMRLLPLMDASGRVINLSSAAQNSIDTDALRGKVRLPDGAAYAQSKLALTMWSSVLAKSLGDGCPVVIAVNPGSLLGTKMVTEAFGMAGKDVEIGVNILFKMAVEDQFAHMSGKYYDNDRREFAAPHPDALDVEKSNAIVKIIEELLQTHLAKVGEVV